MNKNRIFREINIWKPVNERCVARYRCFEILPDEKFFVQSKDFIYQDSDNNYLENLDGYFFGSLLSESFKEMVNESSSTIEEAIAKHEGDFKEMNEAIQNSIKKEI